MKDPLKDKSSAKKKDQNPFLSLVLTIRRESTIRNCFIPIKSQSTNFSLDKVYDLGNECTYSILSKAMILDGLDDSWQPISMVKTKNK